MKIYIYIVFFVILGLVFIQAQENPNAYGWELYGGSYSPDDSITMRDSSPYTGGPIQSQRGIWITIDKDGVGGFTETFKFQYLKDLVFHWQMLILRLPYRAVINNAFKFKLGIKCSNGIEYWPDYDFQPPYEWEVKRFSPFYNNGNPPPVQNDSVYVAAILLEIFEINGYNRVGFQFDYIGDPSFAKIYEWVGNDPPIVSLEPNPITAKFTLQQNYPNPFNPSTIIEYSLPTLSNVNLTIYNVLGQIVATLVNYRQNVGVHKIRFTPNRYLPAGVYYYRLTAGKKFTQTRKMLLTK